MYYCSNNYVVLLCSVGRVKNNGQNHDCTDEATSENNVFAISRHLCSNINTVHSYDSNVFFRKFENILGF
jgi:hypothetical protein